MDRGLIDPVAATIPDDPDLARVIAPLAADIHASFGAVLVQAPAQIARQRAPGELPLGSLVVEVMRASAAATLGLEVRMGLTNNGGIRGNLPKGPVRIQDVYEVLPFENELVVAEYTGAEVIAMVQEGILGKGGEPIAGVRASVTGTLEHPLVAITWSDGSAIDPAGTFRVATNDYLMANGGGMPTLKLGRHLIFTSTTLRQVFLDHCAQLGKAGQPILAPEGTHYVFSPELLAAIKAKTFKF